MYTNKVSAMAVGYVELHINLNLLVNGNDGRQKSTYTHTSENGKYGTATIKLVAVEQHASSIQS